MLLDERKTKRRVRIIAVITALAFVGTIIPVIATVLVKGGGPTPVDLALDETKATPNDPDVWIDLAGAYTAGENVSRGDQLLAVEAAKKGVSLTQKNDPKRLSRVQDLSRYQSLAGQRDAAFATLNNFTKQNPKNAEGFLSLGVLASDQGRIPLAKIALQRYLDLEPNGPSADAVRQRLAQLATESANGAGGGAPATP